MKKLLFVSICAIGFSNAFAGGIVTNTNQSASWVRNPSTAAYTGIEAVYYNPAATALLGDGLHFSISNQTIFQTREVTNSSTTLNQSLYKGTVNAPVFPTIYAVYNKSNFAFSFGFNPIGGGGAAEFEKGLPSLELPVAALKTKFAAQGVTGYSMDAYFKGSSIYFGYQFGMSYKINDMISVYGGVRYVTAKNTYSGHLKDITVTTASTSLRADKFMTDLATQATTGAAQLNGAAAGVGSFATAVGATTTFDDAIAAISDPTQKAQITGLRDGLTGLGVANAGSMPLAAGQGTYTAYANGYTAQAGQLKAGASLTADQEADVEQTGSGICPIVGVNLSLLDKKLDIGLKYEFATKMKVKNKTNKDILSGYTPTGTPTTMFPDGEEINSDMPALLSLGISYKVIEKLNVSGGFYYYFDKAVNYGKKSVTETGTQKSYVPNDSLFDNNFMDITFGLEYTLNEKLLLSAGVLYGKTGVKPEYNSDLSYSNSSTTFGLGGKYSFSPKVALNIGVAYTTYEKATKTISTITETYTETYMKDTWIFGLGLDVNL